MSVNSQILSEDTPSSPSFTTKLRDPVNGTKYIEIGFIHPIH